MVLGFPPSAPGSTPGRRLSPLRVLATAALLCAAAGVAQAGEREAAPDSDRAYAVKANYLDKLTAFVGWPAAAFEGPASPFRLCVGGRDPFGEVIDRATQNRRVGDHPMIVVRLPTVARSAAKVQDCHMLFLSASRTQTAQQMLAVVAGQPVLTVADEDLDAPGAMVQFITVEGRVRFEIRADAAQAEGLGLSSKLQALSVPAKASDR